MGNKAWKGDGEFPKGHVKEDELVQVGNDRRGKWDTGQSLELGRRVESSLGSFLLN